MAHRAAADAGEATWGAYAVKLPFREHAFVPSAKLVDYLLSPTHPVGKSKAQFFAAFGFDATNAAELEWQLITIAHTEDVHQTTSSPYGEKYVVRGILQAADGRQATIATVWIIEPGTERPRFVTAYPV
jgi:hypothetical protein